MVNDYKIVSLRLAEKYIYYKLFKDNKFYFMKKVKKVSPQTLSFFLNEINKYKLVNNLNVLPKMIEENITEAYMICEYLECLTIKEIMNLSYNKKIEVLLKLIDKVSLLHDNGIIHCDLKLSNIIITRDFDVYLLDLDHSCDKGRIAMYGTLRYCSLEQLNGKAVTYQFDIYALGIIIFELLLDKKVFNRLSREAVINAKNNNTILLDEDLNKNIRLKEIIDKSTNSDLNKRYRNILDLKEDLLKIKK
mgnify:CR=1 FL=1